MPRTYTRSLTATDATLQAAFLALKTRADVAALLEISEPDLRFFLYRQGHRYTEFHIRKRKSGTRTISAPDDSLKLLQRKLNQVLQAVYRRKPNVYGFARNKNIVDGAKVHLGKRWILNIDLLDFFPSITFYRVRGRFMKGPYNLPLGAASALAQLCTHNNKLPQGAPTSPVVSNMVCARFDAELLSLAERAKCRVTRYADDISFSTWSHEFPSILARRVVGDDGNWRVELGAELSALLVRNGFEVNPTKVRLRRKDQRMEVTGITINEFPNVQRPYVREVRAMIDLWRKNGLETAQRIFNQRYDRKHRRPGTPPVNFRAVVLGKLEYIRMVKSETDGVYINLRNQISRLDAGTKPIIRIRTDAEIMTALWVLENDNGFQGSAFMLQGHGLVTCAHVLGPNLMAYQAHDPTQRVPARVLRSSEDLDIAILEIPVPPTGILVESEEDATVGQDVIVAGFPNHGPGSTGARIATQVTRVQPRFGVRHFYVANQIQSGNSGGPVLNTRLEVVGIAARGDGAGEDHRVDPSVISISEIRKLHQP